MIQSVADVIRTVIGPRIAQTAKTRTQARVRTPVDVPEDG